MKSTKLKYSLSDIVLDLLRIYSGFDYEVGGMIFSDSDNNIKTISFKKGEMYSLDFLGFEETLYIGVPDTKIIGTWHLHPKMQNSPSTQDIKQWKQWRSLDAHIIINGEGYKIFNRKGVVTYESFFKKV